MDGSARTKAVARELVRQKAHRRSRGRLDLRSRSSVKAEAKVDGNRAEGTGGSTKGITPLVSGGQVNERRGFQRCTTSNEATLATPLHAETSMAEAKASHGEATMAGAKAPLCAATMAVARAPQRVRMRFNTDGRGAAARPDC